MGDDEALDTPASTLEELLSIDLLSATLESLSARGECKPARTWARTHTRHAHTPATHTGTHLVHAPGTELAWAWHTPAAQHAHLATHRCSRMARRTAWV